MAPEASAGRPGNPLIARLVSAAKSGPAAATRITIYEDMHLKTLLFRAILLVTPLASIEGASLCVQLIRGKAAFDYSRTYIDGGKPSLNMHLSAPWMANLITHPYFGSIQANSPLDFRSPDYRDPTALKAEKDEYVVGLFGGSVAMGMDVSKETFVSALRESNPSLRGRKIVFINYGSGGGRQPLQFFASSYFLDALDLIVNLDGYNDLNPGNVPGGEYPPDFPSNSRFFLQPYVKRLSAIYELDLIRRLQSSVLYRSLDWPLLSHSQTYRLVAESSDRLLENAARGLQGEINRDGSPGLPARWSSGADQTAARAAVWKRYTRKQFALAHAFGKPVYFFIQPNQYVAGSKEFTDEEKRIALSAPQPWVDSGYRQLLTEAEGLRREGIPVVSLVRLFKDEKGTVYSDDCCHVNRRGNDMMARAMARMIHVERPGRSGASGN